MLKDMTKAAFIEAVDQRKFLVKEITYSKYDVYMIHFDEVQKIFGLGRIPNPGTKDGAWIQRGSGFNKAVACIEDIAYYINKNAPDKDSNPVNCAEYFQQKQRYGRI